MSRAVALILGPHRGAVSGVSTHLNLLLDSSLAREFVLRHFQVGSEGRRETGPGRLVRLAASPFALALEVFARGVSIVHINTSLNARAFWRDLAYLVVARVCGARVVYQVHGGALPQRFFHGRLVPTALLRAALMLPDVIVVLARMELRAYRKFVPAQNVIAIPNGIDPAPYAAARRPARAARQPLRLLYIGRLAREKGLYETLQGLRLACSAGAEANLVIAGSGPEEATLRRLTDALGLGGRVAFAGPVFGERKTRLFGESDVLVLASHGEGMPYVVLEGMAAGAAIIATRVGAIPDLVADGLHGLYVPPHNPLAIAQAILRLDRDRALLARMSEACRRRIASGYSRERLAGSFRELYAQLDGGRTAKALGGS